MMDHMKRMQKKSCLEKLLAMGSARHARTLEKFNKEMLLSGTDAERHMRDLFFHVKQLQGVDDGDKGIDRDTMRRFFVLLRMFTVHEFKELERESRERLKKAETDKERIAWAEQADEFKEMWQMNEETGADLDYDEALTHLKLTTSDDRMSKTDFMKYVGVDVVKRLPERWFISELATKASRTVASQMSLRFMTMSSSSGLCSSSSKST
eukprot:g2469.t1